MTSRSNVTQLGKSQQLTRSSTSPLDDLFPSSSRQCFAILRAAPCCQLGVLYGAAAVDLVFDIAPRRRVPDTGSLSFVPVLVGSRSAGGSGRCCNRRLCLRHRHLNMCSVFYFCTVFQDLFKLFLTKCFRAVFDNASRSSVPPLVGEPSAFWTVQQQCLRHVNLVFYIVPSTKCFRAVLDNLSRSFVPPLVGEPSASWTVLQQSTLS
jgi:hypothetical protein